MAFYIVSYDLHKGKDYPRVYKGITELTNNWCNLLASVYIVESHKTASQIEDFLNNYIDKDDSLIIIETKTSFNWAAKNLDDDTIKWLG